MTISKWVNLIFAGILITAFLVMDKALKWIWTSWSNVLIDYQAPGFGSYFTLTTALALATAIGFTFYLYRKPGTFAYLSEVVSELTRVTWPSIDETKRSTVIVIVFTFMLSAYLAVFDWIWKIVTAYLISSGT